MQTLKLLLSTPLMWIWYIFLGALILLRSARKDRRMRRGWYVLAAGFLFFTMLSFMPFSDMLTQPFLRQYSEPPAVALEDLDVVTVLGGGGREGKPSSATNERIRAGIEMFKKSSARFIAVQGAAQVPGEPTDAAVMKSIALAQGVPAEKILVDPLSRTTGEHPVQLRALLPDGIMRIGLVTSALHLPRAMAVFQKYFPDKVIVPLPVGTSGWPSYRSVNMVPSIDAFSQSTAALHEWIGIVWYYVRY